MKFANVSHLMSYDEFEKAKDFILINGDRMTYRNYDNNNPHYHFDNFDAFLGADIGQGNINNDPAMSDFNQLTIVDWESSIQYYNLIIVRKGDLAQGKAWIMTGMVEGEVYLWDYYDKGLDVMKGYLPVYLESIQKKVSNSGYKS